MLCAGDSRTPPNRCTVGFLVLLVCTAVAADAQTFNVVQDFFGADAASPISSLAHDADGAIYATTTSGGSTSSKPDGCGTAFGLTFAGAARIIPFEGGEC
jgi:hypothetical protein